MSPAPALAAVDASRSPIDWGAAFEQHRHWLQTVIRNRLGESTPVEDVLQEVGLAALKGDNRPTEPDRVAPWLYRVAIRQCLFYRRTRGRRRKFEDRLLASGTEGSSGSPLDWLLEEERLASIRTALAELPELDREILILKYTENWTYQDLARRLGVTVHTVEHRLIKAKQKLRKLLSTTIVPA